MPNSQPVGVMSIVLQLNAASYSEAISEAQRKLDSLAGKAKVAGHSTVSSMQAASAAIRELNGDFTNNIRAVERFITQNEAAGKALQTIFPVVGAAAFLAVIGEGAYKLYEFSQSGKKAAKEVSEGMRSISDETRKVGASLDVANDKLGNAIAKLEHKPENLLKLALDEDREAAIDLATEVDNASKKIDDLLAKNGISSLKAFGLALTGNPTAPTTSTDKIVTDAYASVKSARDRAVDAMEAATPETADAIRKSTNAMVLKVTQQALKAVDAARDQVYARQRDDVALMADAAAQGTSYGGTNFSKQTDTLEQAHTILTREAYNTTARANYDDSQIKHKALQRKKEDGDEAAAAARKAAQEKLRGYETEFNDQRDQGAFTVKPGMQEEAFWRARIDAFRKGSEEYKAVQQKIYEASRTSNLNTSPELRRMLEEQKRFNAEMSSEAAKLDEKDPMAEWKDKQIKAFHETMDASNELNQTYLKLQARIDEFNAEADAGVRMTQLAAATKIASIHTQAYANELAGLNRELAGAQSDIDPATGRTNAKKVEELQAQIAELKTTRAQQQRQDSDRMNLPDATNPYIGLRDALFELARSAQDASGVFRSWFESSLGSTNRGIVEELTTKRHRGSQSIWGGIGHGIATDAMDRLLGMGEGKLLGAVGLGGKKAPTGAAGDPLHVVMAGSAASSLSAAASTSMQQWLNGGGDSSHPGIPAAVSGLLNLMSVPGFAGGTDYAPGGASIVGEHGPELLNIPRGASVTPNGKTPKMSGGDTHNHYYDFTGSNLTRADVADIFERGRPGVVQQSSDHAIKRIIRHNNTNPSNNRI